jgi:hypothetical protein
MRARAATLLVAIAAAVLAGCGGGDSARGDYVSALNKAQNGLAQRFSQLQSKITATSSAAQDRATLKAYESAVGTTVASLRAIDPPQGFDQLHQRFVGEVADYGVALRQARTELNGDDPQEILAAQGRLRTAVQKTGAKLNATIKAINDKLQD